MKFDDKVLARLDELITLGTRVVESQYGYSSDGFVVLGQGSSVDTDLASQWGTSCLNLLGRVFGTEGDHYRNFKAVYKMIDDLTPAKQGLGIMRAAKDDFEHGFLFEARTLIHAEVFDDFLEQSSHLLEAGYHQPAAVIAGSVLEDGLRKLCDRSGIALSAKPKLDQMNADLAKKSVYNSLTQKRITTLADLRNKAAHGKTQEFSKADVEEMIRQVRGFMEEHFR